MNKNMNFINTILGQEFQLRGKKSAMIIKKKKQAIFVWCFSREELLSPK